MGISVTPSISQSASSAPMETLRLFLSAQDKTQNVNDKSEVEKERLENMSSSIMGESLAVLLE